MSHTGVPSEFFTYAVLLACCIAAPLNAGPAAQHDSKQHDTARIPVLDDSETWDRLPEAEEGAGSSLPVWARALATSMPRTTAAMLELDWLHRAASPLDPILRGKMRWTAARANRCEYSAAYALADLKRAGLDDRAIHDLGSKEFALSDADAAAIEFARKLTLAGDTVTDEEVAQLVDRYGDKQVVAMVLLIAHANFQDRLFLSLGFELERSGPLPPVHVRFAKEQSGKTVSVPDRIPPADPPQRVDANKDAKIADADWLSIDYSNLQNKLDAQRDRPGRVRVPTWDEVREWLPDRSRRNDPLRIKWSLVCIGYQPELALGWSACMRAFGEESRQDRVFEESLFWVITRTIHCFY